MAADARGLALAQPALAHAPPGRRFWALDLLDNRYPSLHGLRALAILSVIQFHVTWILSGEQGIRFDAEFVTVSLSIFFGMDLFFVLSGFLIGSILLHSLDTAGTTQLRRFYVRRVLRTFPSYYLVLTILALVTPLTAQQRAHLPFEYLYLTNFMPLGRPDVIMFWGWSLGLEEQFYLVVPFLLFVLHRMKGDRARIIFLAAFWSLGTAIRSFIYFRHRPWTDLALYGALYFRTFTRFDTLVAGILLALVHRRYQARLRAWLEEPRHRAWLALLAMTCLWVLLFPDLFGAQHVQFVHVYAWGTITSIFYFSVLLLLLHREGLVQRLLSAPLFRRFATLGYGVYLVHIPIVDRLLVPAAHRLEARGIFKPLLWCGAFVVVTLASVGLAYLLHVFVEKPCLRLRERWAA